MAEGDRTGRTERLNVPEGVGFIVLLG